MPAIWSNTLGTIAAPWRLVGLCRKKATWHTIGDAAEVIVRQCHGGLVVLTPAGDQDPLATPEAAVALRSLIQLDGDVLLIADRAWIAEQTPQTLKQALARHEAQISAALKPLRRGFDTAGDVLVLADRSRWTVLAGAGLSQTGAVAFAPSFASDSLSTWLHAAVGQLEVVALQAVSLILIALHLGLRRALRWWIRRRIDARLPGLLQDTAGQGGAGRAEPGRS